MLWVSHGVKIFRVDNPHTKPVWFWEWLIGKVNKKHPEVVFLAEAFTRPAMMHALGRAGFQQSYTYFTWRNTKDETARSTSRRSATRPRRSSGRTSSSTPRTSSPSTCSSAARRPSRSAPRWPRRPARSGACTPATSCTSTWPGPAPRSTSTTRSSSTRPATGTRRPNPGRTLAPYLTRLNAIRRAHPALGDLQNLTVHQSTDTATVVYSKHKTLARRDQGHR